MKKFISALLAPALAICALTACSDSGNSTADSTAAPQQTQSDDSAAPTATGNEPDVIGSFVDGKGETFIGMTLDEFSSATGGNFTEANAAEYTKEENELFAKYYLGKQDSILCGRVPLGKECDVYIALEFTEDKLSRIRIYAETMTKDEAKTVCESFISAFDGKLPEGYTRFPDSERGKTVEVGFTKGRDDYYFTLTRTDDFDGNYYVYYETGIYSVRYGM